MIGRKTSVPCCLIALALAWPAAWGQNPSLTIDVSHPGAKISPTLYGIFMAAVKILLPATGMADYAAPWLSVAVTGREPTGKSRFQE
jgi:hypothetical protein